MTTSLFDGDLRDLIGHTWITKQGYLKRSSGNQTDILVHRFIVEHVLGRKLKSTEHVHHINGNKLDNKRENLLVCDNKYHQELHARERVRDLGFDFHTHKWCYGCRTCHPKEMFSPSNHTGDGLSGTCRTYSADRRRGKGYGKFGWKERMDQQFRRSMKKNLVTCLSKEGICP